MIAIVDYGLGNVGAFANMYKRMNIACRLARNGAELEDAQGIVLPGVGAFDHAMQLLDASGMRDTLDRLVRHKQVPVLGVCVGMQILAEGSDEGERAGLGWVPGRVRHLQGLLSDPATPLPHMGWNDVRPVPGHALFRGLESEARFYFLHSFYFDNREPSHAAGTSRYGGEFACAVHAGNVYGVQFHPEKSHHFGAQLLKNFAELAC